MRNITSVFPTKNTSSKIVSEIMNGWELNVPYLALLGYAVIIISHRSVEFQQISGAIFNIICCPRWSNIYNHAKLCQGHSMRLIINFKCNTWIEGSITKGKTLNKSFSELSILVTLIIHVCSQTNPVNKEQEILIDPCIYHKVNTKETRCICITIIPLIKARCNMIFIIWLPELSRRSWRPCWSLCLSLKYLSISVVVHSSFSKFFRKTQKQLFQGKHTKGNTKETCRRAKHASKQLI